MIRRIKLPPGLNKDSTQYASGGSWYDSNNVRFRGGYAESIGGWADTLTMGTYQGSDSYMHGIGRDIFSWTDYSGNRLGCVGTNWKFYVISGIQAVDITPIENSFTGVSDISLASHWLGGSEQSDIALNEVRVTFASPHNMELFTFFSIANVTAAGLLGNITGAVLNQEHQVSTVVDANNIKFILPDGVVANSSDIHSRAASSVKVYTQIDAGQPDQTTHDGGWGNGAWDSPDISWGYSSTAFNAIVDAMRTVSIDNYNEDLMISIRGGPIYYYDVSENIENNSPKAASNDTRAQVLSSFTGSSDTPTIVDSFLVSERDGHCIAFGANDIGLTTQNAVLVRWSDQNNPFDWTPTDTNTAGGQMLRMGSSIIGSLPTRSEILVWTDSALYSMRFVGPPDVFSFSLISGHVNLISRDSAINVANVVYYMGDDSFYVYSGSVSVLPCPVRKAVFDDLNRGQLDKCFAGSNVLMDEVYWMYPSANSVEADKYVCFNYAENSWSMGSFDMSAVTSSATETGYNRTSWEDVSVREYPSTTFIKELDRTTNPPVMKSGVALHELPTTESSVFVTKNCSVETGDIDVSDGDSFSLVSRFIPDIMLPESKVDESATIDFTMTGKDFPGGTTTTSSSTSIVVDPLVGSYTPVGNNSAVRIRGRSISMKFSSSSQDFTWRLGDSRVDTKPDGRR